MANHLHKQIRDAAKTALTGLTTTTTHVYANRLHPLTDAELPALRLYLDEEQAERLTMHANPALERTLTLVVEGAAKYASGLDDSLDQIGKEVEVALSGGLTVGGHVIECLYSGMTYQDEIGDKPVGIKRLTFSIPFAAVANAPDTLI